MIKRLFDSEKYIRIGSPDLNNKIFFNKNGVKRWGKVVLVKRHGFKDKIQIGIELIK